MELSLKFIQNRLKDRDTELLLNGFSNPCFRQVQFYIGSPVKQGVLYVCGIGSGGSMPGFETGIRDIGMIWADSEKEPPRNMPVLRVRECGDIFEIYNEVAEIFAFYQGWSAQVYQGALERRSIRELFELLNLVTPNPWYLADSSFRISVIRKDQDMEEMSAIWRYQYSQRHLPIHVILALAENGGLERMNKRRHAFIPPKEPFVIPFVCKTLFSPKGILGHFYIVCMYSQPSDYEIEIAEFFGNVLNELLARDNAYLPTQGRFYDDYLIDLIEGKEFENEEVLEEVFRIFSWLPEDRFFIVALKGYGKDSDEKTVNGLEIHLLEKLYICRAFLYHDDIVVIFNFSKTKRARAVYGIEEFEKDILSVLQDFGGKAGYSEPMDGIAGFRELNGYYHQAAIALEFALEKGGKIALCGYADIAVRYIGRALSACIPSRLIYHQGLCTLRAYDEANNTDLYETLRQYLNCGQNTTQTARVLYIHRNSLMYRLEKIWQLTELDLSDPEVRIRLMLSFYLSPPN